MGENTYEVKISIGGTDVAIVRARGWTFAEAREKIQKQITVKTNIQQELPVITL